MSGRDCRVSSIYFSFLVFGLQMFDDLCFSFKMDCEKQNNKSKSTVVMLRNCYAGMWKSQKAHTNPLQPIPQFLLDKLFQENR